MESTTTTTASYIDLIEHSYNDTSYMYTDTADSVSSFIDGVNGCRVALIVLAVLLNLAVLVLVVGGWLRQAAPKPARPTLLVMAASSVLLLALAAGLDSIIVYRAMGNVLDLGCRGMLAIEVGYNTLSAVSRLLVAAVAVAVAVRIQRLVSVGPALQLALAALLVLMSAIYGLVVVVPVFFFRTLSDHAEPCFPDTEHLIIALDGFEAATIPEFAVPQSFVFLACALLLLAYVTRSRVSSTSNAFVHYNAVPAPQNDSTAESAQVPSGEDPPLRMVTPGQAPLSDRCRFPWHILLAGAASFLGGILYFVYIRMTDVMSLESSRKMWAVSSLLWQLTGVLLPICWLLDGDVRALCCGCGHPSRPPSQEPGK